MLKNVSAPAESVLLPFPDALMRRLMFLLPVLPRGSSFSLLACEMHVRFSYIVPLTCSGTIDMQFVLQQGYLQHKTERVAVGLLALIQEFVSLRFVPSHKMLIRDVIDDKVSCLTPAQQSPIPWNIGELTKLVLQVAQRWRAENTIPVLTPFSNTTSPTSPRSPRASNV